MSAATIESVPVSALGSVMTVSFLNTKTQCRVIWVCTSTIAARAARGRLQQMNWITDIQWQDSLVVGE